MRIVFLNGLLALACATNLPVAPATPQLPGGNSAPSCVDRCPRGYAMTSAHDQVGCWEDGKGPVPDNYEIFCCPDSHFWLWRPKQEQPTGVGGIVPARDAQGSLIVEEAIEPSEHTAAEFDNFYLYLRRYLHEHPNPSETRAHLRYHAYYTLADELGETPSAILVEDGRSRELVAEPWFEPTVLADIQNCDADLARAAAFVVPHFTRRGGLPGIVKIQRFRDATLPEAVRVALLHDWLNAVAGMYQDRAEAAKIYGPVLDELERSDPSPLIRQAVPLYRQMLINSTCCGQIHWPNDRPNPLFVADPTQVVNRQDPLLQIYEPDEAWPLPEPHEGRMHKGTCPTPGKAPGKPSRLNRKSAKA